VVVVSASTAPKGCKAKFVFDEKALAKLGAFGFTWDDEKGFALASDRSPLENRPWSPAPARADRIVRPGHPEEGR
jgi:competence protein ComEC